MGFLISEADGKVIPLLPETRVGRSRRADVRVEDPRVSSEHAVIAWERSGWTLKDLASRNGTYVNGTKVAPGVWTPLPAGTRLSFGAPQSGWRLADAQPPRTLVMDDRSGRFLVEQDGEIRLAEDAVILVQEREHKAVLVRGEERQPLADGDVLTVGGVRWRLQQPDLGEDAPALTALQLVGLDSLTLEFTVSADEEHVQLALLGAGGREPLRSRSFDYMLLCLARARLADQRAGEVSVAEEGWVYAEELARGLGIDMSHLNVDVLRARRHLGRAGVREPEGCVERRRGSGQIRIGFRSLVVRETPPE